VESTHLMQRDLSNIKGLMNNNNEMIIMLSKKLESFQRDHESIFTLKKKLFQEQ
jgi:hypothetical protein